MSEPAPKPRGLFVGLATYDIVQLVERLPLPNQKTVALDFLGAAGGPAANAAIAFARCGGAASLSTALPTHALSAVIVADLEAHGVDVLPAGTYGGHPITASVLVTRSTGERAVISPTRGASDATIAPPSAGMPSLDGIGAVLIDGYFGALSIPTAGAARRRGIPVILDGGSFKPQTDAAVAAANVAIVSDDFDPPGTDGEPAAVFDYLLARGVTHAAITRGAAEILYVTPSIAGAVPVNPVAVVDSLGAGDFFHGAFAYRVADLGLDDGRFAADLAFAARVAGESLGSFGTRAWLEH
jgi:sugar/nucleoside kinase (ribokinase family)